VHYEEYSFLDVALDKRLHFSHFPQQIIPILPTNSSKLTLSDFKPYGVVPVSSWGTRCVSYPIGVRLAYVSYLLGISPNVVSLLNIILSVATALAVGFYVTDAVWGGVILLLGLQFAYGLDCADGVLARATKRTSEFGAILDKVLDLLGMMLILGLLIISAPGRFGLTVQAVGPLLLLTLTPSAVIAVVLWLKNYVYFGGDKKAVDHRVHTLTWKIARFVAFWLDTTIFRTVLALTWMTSTFVPFMYGYGVFSCVVMVLYIYKTKRDLDAGSEQK
jgi:phosphatidylglycerophosphate synthase